MIDTHTITVHFKLGSYSLQWTCHSNTREKNRQLKLHTREYSHSALRCSITLTPIFEPIRDLRQRQAGFLGQRFLLVGRRISGVEIIRAKGGEPN